MSDGVTCRYVGDLWEHGHGITAQGSNGDCPGKNAANSGLLAVMLVIIMWLLMLHGNLNVV